MKHGKFCSWAGKTRHIIQTKSPKQHGKCAKCKRKLPQIMLNIIRVADNIERNLRKHLDISKRAKDHTEWSGDGAQVGRISNRTDFLAETPQISSCRLNSRFERRGI